MKKSRGNELVRVRGRSEESEDINVQRETIRLNLYENQLIKIPAGIEKKYDS